MNQKREKLTEQFHPITATEARQWYRDGLLNTSGYLWTIRKIKCAPGIKFIIPNVVAFCEEWEISRSAFYRAVDQLKDKGYMSWEATHGLIFKDSKTVVNFPSDKKCPATDTVSHNRDTESHERDSLSHNRDTESHERDTPYIYGSRAHSSDNSDIQITTNSVVAEEEIASEPNSQSYQPTEEEVKAAIQEISQLSPEIKTNSTVTKYVIKFWANFPAALEATKKAVREGNLKNPTGFFMEALKNPSEAPESTAIDMRKFPPTPTEQQKEELSKLGYLIKRQNSDPRYPVVACDYVITNSGNLLWWEALGLDLHELMRQQD